MIPTLDLPWPLLPTWSNFHGSLSWLVQVSRIYSTHVLCWTQLKTLLILLVMSRLVLKKAFVIASWQLKAEFDNSFFTLPFSKLNFGFIAAHALSTKSKVTYKSHLEWHGNTVSKTKFSYYLPLLSSSSLVSNLPASSSQGVPPLPGRSCYIISLQLPFVETTIKHLCTS